MKIVVTGAAGLLGWHCAARLHAANCGAHYKNAPEPYELALLGRAAFEDEARLAAAIRGADAVLHFAGINRGDAVEIERANPAIANALAQACQSTGTRPHIVYANSTHAAHDTPYGRSKRMADEILAEATGAYTNLILPHIFGECARPRYNNVTATLIDQLWRGEVPTINPGAQVELLHAGAAAELAIEAILRGTTGTLQPAGRSMAVEELWARLQEFHAQYSRDVFPVLTDPFDLALFNSYRTGGFPHAYPKPIELKSDSRGALFETSRAAGASQTFVSTTLPGQLRGDHFHTDLVERFLVVSGEAVIRIRKVLTDEVHTFNVSGHQPVAVDMPPLHTHHIENPSDSDVVTFFWTHRHFDPGNSDTFADPVLRSAA